MSGTHGTEDGVSALTELETKILIAGRTIKVDLIDNMFYKEDCSMVGIVAGPSSSLNRDLAIHRGGLDDTS